MNKISILDCTLRDGGYINDWNFTENGIKFILNELYLSGVDYIECGFLEECNTNNNKSIFNSIEKINDYLPEGADKSHAAAMITYGKFPIEKVPDYNSNLLSIIRLIYKKPQKEGALKYARELIKKGYKVFINPTFIDQYSLKEIVSLVDEINEIKPFGFSIVDSMGVLNEKKLLEYTRTIDDFLDKNIVLCFHSHNNLQLSFSNAQSIIKENMQRQLIIDTCIFGMGRGAGNLPTELLANHLNTVYNKNYDLLNILKVIDEHIAKIFAVTPWGYSVPYYLAAINSCHPNYAAYLVDKQTITVEAIDLILKNIPKENKATFNKDLIKDLYIEYQSNFVDDTKTIQFIKDSIKNRNVLILAPGKSLEKEKTRIDEYIKNNNPFIFSLNINQNKYPIDIVFITNAKRYLQFDFKIKSIITSNIIEKVPNTSLKISYAKYINNSPLYDNATLIILKVLLSIGVKRIAIAGLDGFVKNLSENYAQSEYILNSSPEEFDIYNKIMKNELRKISNVIDITSITKSMYFENI